MGEEHALADVLMVTALEEERDAVLAKLDWRQLERAAEDGPNTYYAATLATGRRDALSYELRLSCLTRMGEKQAALRVADALRRWRPRNVVFVGIAGGVTGEVNLGDIVVANQIVDCTLAKVTARKRQIRTEAFQPDELFLDACTSFVAQWQDLMVAPRPDEGAAKRVIGPVASSDEVIAARMRIAEIRALVPKLVAVEMEAGGAAAAVHRQAPGSRFSMVRGISDLADSRSNKADKRRWRVYACDVAATYTVAVLRSGPFATSTRGSVVDLSSPVRTALDLVAEIAATRKQQVRTPHVLRALLPFPRVARLLDAVEAGQTSELLTMLEDYLRTLAPEAMPFQVAPWNERAEVRRAAVLALETKTSAIDEVALFRAILESSSRTIEGLRKRLGDARFARLKDLGRQESVGNGTPGVSGMFGKGEQHEHTE